MKIEELALTQGEFKDLSITEIHTIEAIGPYNSKKMSEVADKLNITTGTLTTAVSKLIKKEYLKRKRSKIDRRMVYVSLTSKGKHVYKAHQKFHTDMVNQIIKDFNNEEKDIFLDGLKRLKQHLKEIHKNLEEVK